jgi:hypothetical protein
MTGPTSRRDHGKGHSYLLDGEKVPGVTRENDEGYPKPALVNWAANVTCDFLLDRWDELKDLTPSARDKILRRARWDYLDEAAQRGKLAHVLIQKLARGEEVEPPEDLLGYVDAYLRFVDEWTPREVLIEAPVFSREFRYAGTLDVVAYLADGRSWLLDWKTGGKGPFPEHVLQLAAYRYADFWLDGDGNEQPMPVIDRAGFVWIRDGEYDLLPADADDDAFSVFGAVQTIARFREYYRDEWPPLALDPPERRESVA